MITKETIEKYGWYLLIDPNRSDDDKVYRLNTKGNGYLELILYKELFENDGQLTYIDVMDDFYDVMKLFDGYLFEDSDFDVLMKILKINKIL